jgi:hypothetical protein
VDSDLDSLQHGLRGWNMVGDAMNRPSPIWHWSDGPEYEPPEETDAERAKRIQQQTILTNNQLDLLKDIIEEFRK